MKNFTRKINFIGFAVIIFAVLINGALYSQSYGGGYTSAYLQRDVGTRAIGMGGAFTAISNDPLAVFYNPAGLADVNYSPAINVAYSLLDIGRYHSTLYYGQKLNDKFAVGAGINSFGSGSFMMRDIMNNPIKEMSANDYSIAIGGAYSLKFVSIGTTVKYLSNSLYGVSGNLSGYSVDLGSKFNVLDMFTFALAVNNIFSNTKYSDGIREVAQVPYTIRTGFAFEIPFGVYSEDTRNTITGENENYNGLSHKYLAIDLDARYLQHTKYPSVLLGVEYAPFDILTFRGGIELFGENRDKAEFMPMNTWGAGIAVKPLSEYISFPISFEYSVASDYISFNKIAHHISVSVEF